MTRITNPRTPGSNLEVKQMPPQQQTIEKEAVEKNQVLTLNKKLDLLRAVDVDASKITKATLTLDGYVIPNNKKGA